MNERIQELYQQAHIGGYFKRFDPDTFAELIVKECIFTIQQKIVRNGNTPENMRSRNHVNDIAEKFDIELPMTYFGVDNVV